MIITLGSETQRRRAITETERMEKKPVVDKERHIFSIRTSIDFLAHNERKCENNVQY